MLTFRPIASAGRVAKKPLGGALKDWMIPRVSITIIASGTVSSTDCKCASRSASALCECLLR